MCMCVCAVCVYTQHLCKEHLGIQCGCAEKVCAPTLCVSVYCQVSVLPVELTQAWVWGLFLRKPGLMLTSVIGRNAGGGCGCWDFLLSKRAFL